MTPTKPTNKHNKADAQYRADELEQRLNSRIERLLHRINSRNTKHVIDDTVLEKYYIVNKSGIRQQFKMWPHQKQILNVINESLSSYKPIRIILDKPRQCGSSAFFSLVVYYLVSRFNLNAVIIGHADHTSQNLYEKIKLAYMYDNKTLRGYVKPEVKNRRIMEFAEGGRIQVVTAGSDEAVTGSTNQVILATEQAIWCKGNKRKAADQMRGLLNTVSDTSPFTFVFIESTGRPASDFQDRWNEAIKGNTAFQPVFVPWFDIAEYTIPFKNEEDRTTFQSTLTTEEEEVLNKFPSVTLEQMNWRRYILLNKCRGVTMESKLIDLHTEYPATYEESFSASDSALFDGIVLNKLKSEAEQPIFVGELFFQSETGFHWEDVLTDISTRSRLFRRSKFGRLKLWEWPEKNVSYVIGADISEGIESGTFERDDSAIVLRRKDNGKHVLSWVGKMPVDDFADLLHAIGMIYNIAFICPEANNMGIMVAKRLWATYPRYALYRSKTGIDSQEQYLRVGFLTSHINKLPMLHQFAISVNKNRFVTHDHDLIDEMFTAVQDSKGKVDTGGKDIFMAAALSEEAMQDTYETQQIVEDKPVDMYVEWKKWKKSNAELSKVLTNQRRY